jgi:hypothetical protein
MEQEKEGEGTSVLNIITEAAKTSVGATIEGVSSAGTNIVEAQIGEAQKAETAFNHEESCREPGKNDDQAGKGEAT